MPASVEDMTEALNANIEKIVTAAVQKYLGTSAPLPPSSRLLEDLGIDSLGFVSIIMELTDQLRLDLMAVDVNLSEIETLRDVVSVVTALVKAVRA